MTATSSFTRCLITGASGFVGGHLARRLVREGKQVHLLLRSNSSLESIEDIASAVHIHRVSSDTQSVIEALTLAKPEVVFHLAAMFRAEHKPEEIAPMLEANITFTTQLLEAMQSASCNAIVNTGTAWQHYQDAPYDPVCLYAATKQAAEDIITFYCNAHGFRAVTLKLYDTYGPGDRRQKLFNVLARAASTNEPIAFSAGEQMLDLVHIEDVVDAYLIAAEEARRASPTHHANYGVASGTPIKLRDIAALYESAFGVKLNIAWGLRPYRAREVMHVPTLPSIAGWHPNKTLTAATLRDALSAAS